MTSGGRVSRLLILALALLAPATMVRAAAPATQSNVSAAIILPVTVTKLSDMDFGNLSVTTAGTAVLEPNADTFSTTGGVIAIGGAPQCAEFVGASKDLSVVNIKLPNKPSTLTRVGGHANHDGFQFHPPGPEQAHAGETGQFHLPRRRDPERGREPGRRDICRDV